MANIVRKYSVIQISWNDSNQCVNVMCVWNEIEAKVIMVNINQYQWQMSSMIVLFMTIQLNIDINDTFSMALQSGKQLLWPDWPVKKWYLLSILMAANGVANSNINGHVSVMAKHQCVWYRQPNISMCVAWCH